MARKTTKPASIRENLKLSEISENKDQIRKAPVSEQETKALEASLLSHGLLQSIVVTRDPKKKDLHTVIAGNRRVEALKRLATQGKMDPDMEIPCLVLETLPQSTQALEASIAENDIRAPANPVDRQEAYTQLGMSTDDISKRFGVPVRQVKADLMIARVHPEIKEKARVGDLPISSLRMYALCPDQAVQKTVYDEVGKSRNSDPSTIRSMLFGKVEYAGGSMGRYCDLKEYEKRGGRIIEDMISRDEKGNIMPHSELQDIHILKDLVQERLEKEANDFRDQGWVNVKHFAKEGEARLVLAKHSPEQPEGKTWSKKEKKSLSVILFLENGATTSVEGLNLTDQSKFQQTLDTAQEIEEDTVFQESELAHDVEPGLSEMPENRAALQTHFAKTRARIFQDFVREMDGDESSALIACWMLAEMQTHMLCPEYRHLITLEHEKGQNRMKLDPEAFLLTQAKAAYDNLKTLENPTSEGVRSELKNAFLSQIDTMPQAGFAKNIGKFFGIKWSDWKADAEYFKGWKRLELHWLVNTVAGEKSAEYILTKGTRDNIAEEISWFTQNNSKKMTEMKREYLAPDSMKAFRNWKPIGISPSPAKAKDNAPNAEKENRVHA